MGCKVLGLHALVYRHHRLAPTLATAWAYHCQALQEGTRPSGHRFPGEKVWGTGRSKGWVFWGHCHPKLPHSKAFPREEGKAHQAEAGGGAQPSGDHMPGVGSRKGQCF